MLLKTKSPIYPEGWTGDMSKDDWHKALFQTREEIAHNLDKFHEEEINYINNKLNTNDKAYDQGN